MGSSALAFLSMVLVVQAPQASVTGTVRDAATGAGLAGASVVLRDYGHGTDTDETGRYTLRGVPAGPQHLTISRLGYASRTVHALVPPAGALDLDVALPPEPIALDRLDVHRPADAAPPDVTGGERAVRASALAHHPLLAEPDAFGALAGGAVLVEPESPAGVHVRGSPSDHTGFVLDGIPILNPYHAAGLFSAWNPDALDGIELISVAPSPALPDVLGGTIAATTRARDARLTTLGGISTTHVRAALSGPGPLEETGYLVSWRSGHPGLIAPDDDASYLDGESHDLLGRIAFTLRGGDARVLVYDAGNALSAAATVAADTTAAVPNARNEFAWTSRSVGAAWRRALRGRLEVHVVAWHATTAADATWLAGTDLEHLDARRTDDGATVTLAHGSERSTLEGGVRVQRGDTRYAIRAGGTDADGWRAAGATWVTAAFARYVAHLSDDAAIEGASALLHAADRLLLAPRARLTARMPEPVEWTVAVGRSYQFTQSLQNPESVVRYVFPADLAVGAGVGGVPIAHSDQGVLAVEWRATPGVRLGTHAYARTLRDLVLVAPVEDDPFAHGAVRVADGRAWGAGASFTATASRWTALITLDWQRVRLEDGDSAWTPAYATSRRMDAGLVFHPSATASLRLALAGGDGRSSTALAGPFEWEACNVLDRGCEFAGSPGLAGRPGAEALPAYLRVDAGGRKHWHLRWRGRDLTIGAFATVTNVFGRTNVLGRARSEDGAGERAQAIGMVPRSPLVIGLDWRY